MIHARVSVALIVTFVGLFAILHVLEPQMNSGQLISEYQLTRHGWMMSLAFCSFGVGAMLVASAWRSRALALIELFLESADTEWIRRRFHGEIFVTRFEASNA